ncbi:MAG: NrtA/SsuA/CpmA family ABC transporter substrate-binding protein [Terrisporobacter sp.]
MVTGCSLGKKSEYPKDMNITYVKSPLNVPSILEKNDELFQKEFEGDSIKVNWSELTTGPEQTQALAAGEIDFCHAIGGTSALIAASNRVNLKIIGTYSKSPKGFMIVSNNDSIKSAKDLKGKKIGGPKGTILHQILVSALKKENMTLDDVEFVDMTIPDATSALEGGSVDCALVAGPSALQAIKGGKTKVVDGEGLVDGIIVIAVNEDFAEKYPELVERFMKIHKETLNYMESNYDEMISKISKEVDLGEEETKELYKWYDFSCEIGDNEIKALEETQKFLIDNKMQENEVNVEDLILEVNTK